LSAALASTLLVFSHPSRYESTARLMPPDSSSVPACHGGSRDGGGAESLAALQ